MLILAGTFSAHRLTVPVLKRNYVTKSFFLYHRFLICTYTQNVDIMETALTWLTNLAQIEPVCGRWVTAIAPVLQWSKLGVYQTSLAD